MPRLISKRVRVLDCNCSWFSTQGSADRFGFCECKVRVEKGKRHAIESPAGDQTYNLGTVFIAAHPNQAFKSGSGEGFTLTKKPVPLPGSSKHYYTEVR